MCVSFSFTTKIIRSDNCAWEQTTALSVAVIFAVCFNGLLMFLRFSYTLVCISRHTSHPTSGAPAWDHNAYVVMVLRYNGFTTVNPSPHFLFQLKLLCRCRSVAAYTSNPFTPPFLRLTAYDTLVLGSLKTAGEVTRFGHYAYAKGLCITYYSRFLYIGFHPLSNRSAEIVTWRIRRREYRPQNDDLTY